MAISAVPYALQNGSHSADLFRQAVSSLVPPGGGLVSTGDLTVTQTGTASMNVVFGVGRAWVPGTNVGNVAGGNFSKQAMYFALNDAAFTASIATANATNPRIDVAYLAVQDSQYAGTTNTAVLGIATGVPTAGATYPANAPTIPANAIALAWVNVPANASQILTANINPIAVSVVGPPVYSNWVTTDANWTYGGGFVKSTVGPRTFIQLNGTLTRAGGGSISITSTDVDFGLFIPTGFFPPTPISAFAPVTTGTTHNGEPVVTVNTNGHLIFHAPAPTTTVAVGAAISFSMGWYQ